jgi:hypothetical protein
VRSSILRRASNNLVWVALAIVALTGCKGTAGDGEGGDGAGGVMNATAGTGGSGASGGAAGSSGVSGGAAGSGGGGGSGGTGGAGGAGAGGSGGGGSGGQGGDVELDSGVDAPSDAGQDSGPLPASCTGGGYLICEDFEATGLDAVPDGWSEYGAPIGVADDEAASGTKSLKLGQTNDARIMFRDASSLPTTHWGRIRYRVDADVPDAFVHSTLVSFTGKSPADDADLEMRVVDTVKQSSTQPDVANRHQFLYNVQRFGQNEFGQEGPYDWMFDGQWHCVEWYVSSADQAFRFFFDGDEVEQMAFENGAGNYDNSEIPSTFDELKIGWVNYQEAQPGFTAWIDDVAIADQRVTCAQ